MGFSPKTSWSWITVFSLLSLTANIVFLIGCISPSTFILCLYRVKVSVLAEGLQKLAVQDSGQNPGGTLLHPDLPVYWYWGTSGICDTYAAKNETHCRRQFPPTSSLLDIVESSLTARLGENQTQTIVAVVSAWNATLSSLDPARLRSKQAKFTALSKASAALAVLAAILDVFSPICGLVVFSSSSESKTVPYIAPFLAALLAMGAGALATRAMNEGVHAVVRTGEHGGPGVIILFVGAALRVGSSLLGTCACHGVESERPPPRDIELSPEEQEQRRRREWEQQQERQQERWQGRQEWQQEQWQNRQEQLWQQQQQQEPRWQQQQRPPRGEQPDMERTGYRGEKAVNDRLDRLIPDWKGDRHWTSTMRSKEGQYTPFRKPQEDYADFTYTDRSGNMRAVLADEGVEIDPRWSDRTNFHLEAKATPGDGDRPIFLRESQLKKMEDYNNDPNDAYILVHITHVDDDGRRDIRFIPNPWELVKRGELVISDEPEPDDPKTFRAWFR